MPSHGSITSLSLFSQRHFAAEAHTAEWREQNLDLISGINSASVLLKRIKTEQINHKPQKKLRKKKRGLKDTRKPV